MMNSCEWVSVPRSQGRREPRTRLARGAVEDVPGQEHAGVFVCVLVIRMKHVD